MAGQTGAGKKRKGLLSGMDNMLYDIFFMWRKDRMGASGDAMWLR